MKKIDKSVGERYFREKNTYMIAFFIIWAIVSYGVVAVADTLTDITFIGFPFHYFMGAIGALITFILLLFANAIVGDRIDKKYGVNQQANERIAVGTTLDH